MLEDDYKDFESLENVEKSSYVLRSELGESKFDGLLGLVKEYIVDVWEIRKHKLYDSDSGSGLQLHTQAAFTRLHFAMNPYRSTIVFIAFTPKRTHTNLRKRTLIYVNAH